MALLTAFLTYLAKFIVFLALAAAGFILGRRIRNSKKTKT